MFIEAAQRIKSTIRGPYVHRGNLYNPHPSLLSPRQLRAAEIASWFDTSKVSITVVCS